MELIAANFFRKKAKPARIPPQTPPAGGTKAEAGQFHSPRKIVSPCRVQISFQDFRQKMFELRSKNPAFASLKLGYGVTKSAVVRAKADTVFISLGLFQEEYFICQLFKKITMNTQNGFLQTSTFIVIIICIGLIGFSVYFLIHKNYLLKAIPEKIENEISTENPISYIKTEKENDVIESSSNLSNEVREEYNGAVRHIFSHSLIIYPQKALSDVKNLDGYKNNMLTVWQFKQIIQQLYENNFILIDAQLLYSFDKSGNIYQNKLYLPSGKKPLILSVDDISYYSYMENGGFANKLVLENDVVKTEVLTPEGSTIITNDGDIVPIVDEFVKEHPDFSLDGAKGIIGVTGFEGILGYHTNWKGERGDIERQHATIILNALKKTGWVFASHSFSHKQVFLSGEITPDFLANDISFWASEVEPIVGKTNIFIGPFGQVFLEGDPRRKQLIDAGFNILYGVGMDNYTKFFSNYLVMNRTNIDGYRLRNNAEKLYELFGILVDVDFSANSMPING